MEILRRGTLPSERTADVPCSGCNSLLRVKPSDGVLVVDYDRDGDCYKIHCPVCKKLMYISTKLFKG